MLKYFFETRCDMELFEGLKISKEKDLCDEYMGKYPVISITLKSVEGNTYTEARNMLCNLIGNEAKRFLYLLDSDRLTDVDKQIYAQLIAVNAPHDGMDDNLAIYSMPDAVLKQSLQTLTSLLASHYGRDVIVLIDEYDVPLDKAYQRGYYNEMVSLIRSVFDNVLKTNSSLKFAVLTGCLRIARESIFTGLNNFNVMSITDVYFNDCFGFTQEEVDGILKYYGIEEMSDVVREWYDGYNFGKQSIYSPWDVIKYCQALIKDKDAIPQNYWANTSGNGLVRRFIDKSTAQTKHEIEQLIGGGTIVKPISQELTYNELDERIDNLWSVLFSTGYLTYTKCIDATNYELKIPNLEIRDLFVKEINEWFKETTKKDNTTIKAFCEAFINGNVELIENQLNKYLWNSISIHDIAVRNNLKENFYHGILLGILQYEEDWIIKSNHESGNGYSDILIKTPEGVGIVIELKYAGEGKLEKQCNEALNQIEVNQYEAFLIEGGMDSILKYGIAFYKKKCKVVKANT
jgi:hypothetical protein